MQKDLSARYHALPQAARALLACSNAAYGVWPAPLFSYGGRICRLRGKIGPGEDGLSAAYRELAEETAITPADITRTHFMDFTYYMDGLRLEVYVGKLNKPVTVMGDKNDLYWSDLNQDFFDAAQYAGEGNIGHILLHIEQRKAELFG